MYQTGQKLDYLNVTSQLEEPDYEKVILIKKKPVKICKKKMSVWCTA